jgi:hypothetical protein
MLFKFASSKDRQVVFWGRKGLAGDKVGPKQGPHARATSAQIKDMVIVQKGQGKKQAHLLVHS